MTKDEADEKVKEVGVMMERHRLAQQVREWAEKVKADPWTGANLGFLGHALAEYVLATVLNEAPTARAALDKPRLMTLEDARRVYTQASGIPAYGWTFNSNKGVQAILDADRADILAQAEKLPRPYKQFGCAYADAIFLSDLRNLIQGT